MKVSQEKKAEIRRTLLSSAVELIAQKGFAAATMREISLSAGFSEATIYNYFKNKEGIFFAYFTERQRDLMAALKDIADFDAFTLKEKLQTLVETQLELYEPDRAFVDITFKALLDSPMRSFSELRPAKDEFTRMVRRYFDSEMDEAGINPKPIEDFLVNLFWDYKNLLVWYWLKDESEHFTNTSQLIDMSLDIYLDIVDSGVITKIADVLTFLVKSHLYGNIDKLFNLMGFLAQAHDLQTSDDHGE